MGAYHRGPDFKVESGKAVIVLGNSERHEVGELWGKTLDERRIFDYVDVVTLNEAAARFGRASLRQRLKESVVFTHSAGITRLAEARQVIAINPPEPVAGVIELMRRAAEVGKDKIDPEYGAIKTGAVDLTKAGLELARSPFSTVKTLWLIGRAGYSAVSALIERAEDFPAGRAIVHCDEDGFGFFANADLLAAVDNDIPTLVIEGAHHNEVLFRPSYILDEMTPTILPAWS